MSNKVTLQDIADAANLSKMTVSLALRNSPKIKKSTTELVKKIAQEMHYVPNPLMSIHMSELRLQKKTKAPTTIAYVSSMDPEDGKTAQYYQGAKKRANMFGYQLDFFKIENKSSPLRVSDILFHRNISGVIIGNQERANWHFEMDWKRFAVAVIGHSVMGFTAHRCCSNQFQGARLACQKLSELGYKRIGLVLDKDSNIRTEHNWIGGYLSFAISSPCASQSLYLSMEEFSPSAFMKWYHQKKPDAIITSRKHIPNIDKTLTQNGVHFPQDVGLVNLHFAGDKENYTSVDQHSDLTGASAVGVVIEQLQANEYGLPTIPKIVSNANSWIEGCTTRKISIQTTRINRQNKGNSSA